MKNKLLKKIFFVAIALYGCSSQTHASRIRERKNVENDTTNLISINQDIYNKVSTLDNENKSQVSELNDLKIQRDQKTQELSAIEAEKARIAAEKAKAEEAEKARIAAEKAKAEEAEKARIAEEQAKKAAEDKAKADQAAAAQYQPYRYRR